MSDSPDAPAPAPDSPEPSPAEAGAPAGLSHEALALVRVGLRAELGRTTQTYRAVNAWRPGAVVVLNRLAGEPVELRLRGQVIARGEVTIQDDQFAVRVTEIVDRRSRLLAEQRIRPRPRRN